MDQHKETYHYTNTVINTSASGTSIMCGDMLIIWATESRNGPYGDFSANFPSCQNVILGSMGVIVRNFQKKLHFNLPEGSFLLSLAHIRIIFCDATARRSVTASECLLRHKPCSGVHTVLSTIKAVCTAVSKTQHCQENVTDFSHVLPNTGWSICAQRIT